MYARDARILVDLHLLCPILLCEFKQNTTYYKYSVDNITNTLFIGSVRNDGQTDGEAVSVLSTFGCERSNKIAYRVKYEVTLIRNLVRTAL